MEKYKKTKHKARHFLEKLRFPLFIATLALFFLFFTITSVFAIYDYQFKNKVYPGIKVDTIPMAFKTKDEVEKYFETRSQAFSQARFSFIHEDIIATASGADIGLGVNRELIAEQAFSIGRTGNIFADTYNKMRAWFGEINLPPSYSLNQKSLEKALLGFAAEINKAPIDGVFEMKNNRVVAFRPSEQGKTVDVARAEQMILGHVSDILLDNTAYFTFDLPIQTKEPTVPLESTNTMGIKEHIGQGVSHFRGSIANRVHNITLSASRIDGTIIPKGGVFSFNDAVGDVSKLTGYKEAYIIKDGKTILGDGGGVCQVSSTLFRAILNTGLPVVERHAHSYRVSYYEQASHPGFDATVYAPSYDLKFKNDTNHAVLIEAYADIANATLTFDFYGTSDGREVSITSPVVTNQTPPPPDLYQDDPTLPVGTVKQADFKAAGATVKFSRTVKGNGEVLFTDSYTSNYRPWQAVYLRGTRE